MKGISAMPNASTGQQIKSNVTGRECRVWLRFPSRRIASCQFADSDDKSSWPVHVHDISRTGFNLLSVRKFEKGTILKIGEADDGSSVASLIAARVVQVTSAPDDKWMMSCTFLKELSEQELLAWLKEEK
jgi:PilZ domain